MEAAYTKTDAVVMLDASEVRLILKALDELRYAQVTGQMSGSQLINLAGLSHEWLRMTQDMSSRAKDRVTKPDDGYRMISKAIGKVLPDEYWEIWSEDVARLKS